MSIMMSAVSPPPPLSSSPSPSPRVFYVAADGSDSWNGRAPAHRAGSDDGPFATVQHALEAARAGGDGGGDDNGGGAKTILLRGGRYTLAAPLVLLPADSGVTLAAYPGEHPILSGGMQITGWQRIAPDRWQATLPGVAQGAWYPQQLTLDGAPRYRPRLPKSGYYTIAGDVAPSPAAAGKGFDRFAFRAGEIDPHWHDLADVEVLPFQIWSMSRFTVGSVDSAANVVTLAGHTASPADYSRLAAGRRYLVENVQEALHDPGEWYLDRKTGVLTYLSRPGENPNRATAIVPRLGMLLQVQGDPDRRQWVRNVTLRGLTFSDAAWYVPPGGAGYAQADVDVAAALKLIGARNLRIEGCVVRNVGGYAVHFGWGTQDCTLSDCALFDLGAGGVKIGEQGDSADPERLAGGDTVEDCVIAHGGRIHPAAVGVWIGHSSRNRVLHNEIRDFYYTGVSVGWTWGYAPSGAHDNIIAYNRIERVGQGVLSDMGGIYTLGVSPGTVLDHNVLHDIRSYDYGGWGIYFDEGSTGILASNNVVYDCKSAPFHQHYGTRNRLENNVLALGRQAQLMRTRADNGPQASPEIRNALSFTIERNIVYWKEGNLLGSNWSGTNFRLDRNLYWNAGDDHAVRFAGATLADWRARGFDHDSLIADPLFRDPEHGDFTLRPDSPASRIGFHPIDARSIGPRVPPPVAVPEDVPAAFPTQ